jgi:hypothetical protein
MLLSTQQAGEPRRHSVLAPTLPTQSLHTQLSPMPALGSCWKCAAARGLLDTVCCFCWFCRCCVLMFRFAAGKLDDARPLLATAADMLGTQLGVREGPGTQQAYHINSVLLACLILFTQPLRHKGALECNAALLPAPCR